MHDLDSSCAVSENESGFDGNRSIKRRFNASQIALVDKINGERIIRPAFCNTLIGIALVTQLVALAMPYWEETKDTHWGMWQICVHGDCEFMDPDIKWRTAQCMDFLALLLLIAGTSVRVGRGFVTTRAYFLVLVIPLSLWSIAIVLPSMKSGLSLDSSKDKMESGRMSWSFYLMLLSLVVLLLPALFALGCCNECCIREECNRRTSQGK